MVPLTLTVTVPDAPAARDSEEGLTETVVPDAVLVVAVAKERLTLDEPVLVTVSGWLGEMAEPLANEPNETVDGTMVTLVWSAKSAATKPDPDCKIFRLAGDPLKPPSSVVTD